MNNAIAVAGPEIVERALGFIPAQDRDTWVKVGMAVKSELGDVGFDLWNRWSQTATNYDERDAKAVWRSLSCEGRVTLGTLFYLARQH
jgi:putative DNA primase/helicase